MLKQPVLYRGDAVGHESGGTVALLFVVPLLFILFQWMEEHFIRIKRV